MKKIILSDYTLKDFSEKKTHSLLFREKAALVANIDSFGVDAIELPPVAKPREDSVINMTLASALRNCALKIPAGMTPEEMRAAYESIRLAKKPVLQVVLPMSTVQMEYLYHMKDAKMLEKIKELCTCAGQLCPNVELCCLDATRADRAFLISACQTAVACGVRSITLCDDAGEYLPQDFSALVKDVKAAVDATVLVRVSDKLGLGAANALAALHAGADGVCTCIVGEDVLTLGRIADILAAKGEGLELTSDIKGTAIHTNVQSLLKKLEKPDYLNGTDGASDSADVFLDARCSAAQVRTAVESLGYAISEEDLGAVHDAVKRLCQKKSSIGAKELEAVVASSSMQVPSTYHLHSFNIMNSNLTGSVANIILVREEEKLSGVATGDGPIDSSFKAIEQCVGHHYELDEFQIQAVTEGKEALGSALVRLRSEGKLYSGNGVSTDIVGASIRAYINALNKIVYEEN